MLHRVGQEKHLRWSNSMASSHRPTESDSFWSTLKQQQVKSVRDVTLLKEMVFNPTVKTSLEISVVSISWFGDRPCVTWSAGGAIGYARQWLLTRNRTWRKKIWEFFSTVIIPSCLCVLAMFILQKQKPLIAHVICQKTCFSLSWCASTPSKKGKNHLKQA